MELGNWEIGAKEDRGLKVRNQGDHGKGGPGKVGRRKFHYFPG